jgi:hypothetical protein
MSKKKQEGSMNRNDGNWMRFANDAQATAGLPALPEDLHQDDKGYINVVVKVPLMDLVWAKDTDGLNDLLEDRIVRGDAVLQGIEARVVGHEEEKSGTGSVLVEVRAELVEI